MYIHKIPPVIYNNLSKSLSQQIQGFQVSFLLKFPIFLLKALDNFIEKCGAYWSIRTVAYGGRYFSIGGDFLYYLLTVAAMLTINILLLLIFVNIILILMLLPALYGILSSVSRISSYLLPILLWLINILNSDQLHELLLVCSVLTFFPLTLKLLH